MIGDTFYSAPELRQQLAMAKGARTQADKSLRYAVSVYADAINARQPLARRGRGEGQGRVLQAQGVMDRATRRLEAAEALVAAIEDEIRWSE